MAFIMERARVGIIAKTNDNLSFSTRIHKDKKTTRTSTCTRFMETPHNKRGGRNDNDGNSDDFDDFSSSIDEIQAANDLAKEFYQQVKLREKKSLQSSSSASSNPSAPSDIQTWEMKSSKTFNTRTGRNSNSNNNNNNETKKKSRKFTGRLGDVDSTGTPSAGLFATQNGSVYAVPEKRPSFGSSTRTTSDGRSNRVAERLSSSSSTTTVREQMMRQEFNLVSVASNELTIVVQAVLVMILLSFAIYIGITGGITDGSDRFGTADGEINEYNGLGESLDLSKYMNDDSSITNMIEGVAKDESSSVWL